MRRETGMCGLKEREPRLSHSDAGFQCVDKRECVVQKIESLD